MIKTARQLKALVQNHTKGESGKAQLLIRNFMMERFLERVSLSQYKDNFILKGGMLVSSMVGLDNRATMDIDTTLKNLSLNSENARKIIDNIISVPVEDNVRFAIKNISGIMEDAEYDGIRLSLEAYLETMRIPMKIDLSTGDVITPSESGPHHRFCHFRKPGIRIGKEILIRAAVGVQARRAAVGKKRAVPAAAVSAERIPAAGAAFLRRMAGKGDELKLLPFPVHFFKGILADISQPPLVKHIEIAGINVAIRFDDPLFGADAVHTAGLRRLSDQDADPVLKGTVINRMSGLPVRIPVVEQILQKFCIALRCERIGEASASPFLLKGVDAGDILLPGKALLLKETVDPADASGGFCRHHGQDIKIHLKPFQQLRRFQHAGKAPASIRKSPVFIVQLFIAVQGESHQKMIVVQKFCPLFIQNDAVGLNAVVDLDPARLIFFFQLCQSPVKIQPRKGGFAALKGEGYRMRHLFQRLFYQKLQRIRGHKAAGGLIPQLHFIGVEAVTAAQVAAPGGRFDQERKSRLF